MFTRRTLYAHIIIYPRHVFFFLIIWEYCAMTIRENKHCNGGSCGNWGRHRRRSVLEFSYMFCGIRVDDIMQHKIHIYVFLRLHTKHICMQCCCLWLIKKVFENFGFWTFRLPRIALWRLFILNKFQARVFNYISKCVSRGKTFMLIYLFI